jgi:hypothetical protein
LITATINGGFGPSLFGNVADNSSHALRSFAGFEILCNDPTGDLLRTMLAMKAFMA